MAAIPQTGQHYDANNTTIVESDVGVEVMGIDSATGLKAAVGENSTTALPVNFIAGGGFPTVTWTQTSVSLSGAVSATLIAANTKRKALRWMNVGTNPCTVVPGAGPAVANAGMNYNGNTGTGFQGGSEVFASGDVSTQQFTAISTSGTTVIVWEGV